MAEVVRRRYSRVLRELAAQSARTVEPQREDGSRVEYDAEFSQERLRDAVRRVEEKDADHSLPRLPDLIIVDGGKGQLGSACAELRSLRLYDDVPIVGLAKEREEIFRPDRPEPIVLRHETGALKLMQRIRDEAHRWANGYHQLLMKRRVSESVLDDCPGVSELRKQALLKRFGSVTRLKRANIEELTSVSGISPRLAESIVSFLRTH
jgi:excinuclease ABC subunit C